jgi:hypothetical protein
MILWITLASATAMSVFHPFVPSGFDPLRTLELIGKIAYMTDSTRKLLMALTVGVGVTLIYWSFGLMLLGMLMMGDCTDVEACSRSKDATFSTGLLVEAGIYAVLMLLVWRRRRR